LTYPSLGCNLKAMKNTATAATEAGRELCYCGGLTDTCDGCPDCLGDRGCPPDGRRTYSCLACSREMGVMTRAAYEAAGQECGECEPWTPEER
jgi:hypothetical protein